MEDLKSFNGNSDVARKMAAQMSYCKENHAPYFVPSSGTCYNCGIQIYDNYDLEYCGKNLITGCPRCHISYCE